MGLAGRAGAEVGGRVTAERRDGKTRGAHHLFVYGTLRPGGGAPPGPRRLLASGAERVGRARIRGRLYRAAGGRYPAAVPTEDDRWVVGELYRLRAARRVLTGLDRYEGRRPDGTGLYRREVVRARRLHAAGGRRDDPAAASADPVPAWTYLFNRATSGLEELEGGDWLRADGPQSSSRA